MIVKTGQHPCASLLFYILLFYILDPSVYRLLLLNAMSTQLCSWSAHSCATKGFTLVEIMMVVALVGLLAALAFPSYSRSRSTAQQNACVSNLRQMDSAKEQWALAKSKTSNDEPVTTEINDYIKGGALPSCPAGGICSYNAIGTNPTCTISAPSPHSLPQ